MPVRRFSHIAIRVSDLERSRRFYRDALEFRELTELEIAGGPTAELLGRPDLRLRAVFLERDGTQIELQQIDHPGNDERSGWTRMGLAHLGLRVAGLEDVMKRVHEAGGEIMEASRFQSAEHGSDVVFIADPDGTYIELIEAPGDLGVPPGTPISARDPGVLPGAPVSMRDRRRDFVEFALGEWRALRRVLAFSHGRVTYSLLAIPVLLTALVARLVTVGVLPAIPMEAPLETTALVVLTLALAVAAWRWRRGREPYFLWLSCLVAALLVREIHLKGTSPIFYIGLVAIFYAALRHYSLMAEYFASRTVVSLIVFVFFTYAITQALDRHFFAFVPNERLFERPTEELMEVVGHVGVVLLALLSRKGAEPLRLNR